MGAILVLSMSCVIGIAVWIGIQRLASLYEDRVPSQVQDQIYKVTKSLPQLAFDLCFSLIFWSALGAVLLQLLLTPVGLNKYLPDLDWAPGVVIGTFFIFLLSYWSTPHRPEFKPPRGRDLKNNIQSISTKSGNKSAPEKRGRTIRSYHDLH